MVYGWVCQPNVCTEFDDWICSVPGQFLGTLTYNGNWVKSLVYVSENEKQLLSSTHNLTILLKRK
jgi:hypothetical protein